MMKRIISIALILIILVSVLPVTAFAAGGTSRYDAIPVSFDEAYAHIWTAENDEKDHYISFTMPSRGILAIACTYPVDSSNSYGNMDFQIYNQSGTCIWKTNTDCEHKAEGLAVLYTGLNAGKYYMNITPRFSVASGEFEIVYALSFAAADDTLGTEAEPNNNKAMADTLTVGKEFAGSIGEASGDTACHYDYWKYTNTDAVGYRIYLPEMKEFKKSGKLSHEDSAGNITDIDLMNFKNVHQTEDGIYYFDVKSTKGTNYLRMENNGNILMPYTIWIEPFKNEPLTITEQPESVAVTSNKWITVNVAATGELLSYTWYAKKHGETAFTATSTHTKYYQVFVGNDTPYRQAYCLITDAYGNTIQSDTVTLSMLKILEQPTDTFVAAGEEAVVQFQATGDNVTYQWYVKNKGDAEFAHVPDFTGNTYSVTMDTAVSGRQLYCVITDRFGNTQQTDTVFIAIPDDLRDSGTCGDNVTWDLTYDGLLTISGTGPMQDYSEQQDRPWNPYRNTVKKIVVEEGVTRIGSRAFWYCENTLTVDLPKTVKSIGDKAFSDCKALTGVDLPDGLESIGNGAFTSCESITVLKIPDSVTEIGSRAFHSCEALEEITLPQGITEIKEHTFWSCSNLKTLKIPEGVTTIGPRAFTYCSRLKKIAIPVSVKSIGDSASNACRALNAVYYGGTDRSAIAFGQDNAKLLSATWYYGYDGGELFIPGDLDGDGEITDWDGVLLARHLAGWTVEIADLAAADVDGDGEVTDWDGVVLDRYLAGWNITIG